ncbi:MAG: flavin reductase family protein [Actinomycetes bacterium]
MRTTGVAPDSFKRAASKFPSGVAVVTSACEGLVHGITVSAFSSLSLEPPQVLVCVARWSKLNELVLRSNAFAVNILANDQAHISAEFAKPGRHPMPTFDEMGIQSTVYETRSPVLDGVAAYFDCTVVMACESGDHSVFMGDVVVAGADSTKDPLLYVDRKYRHLAAEQA